MWKCKVCGVEVEDDSWNTCWQCSSERNLDEASLDERRKAFQEGTIDSVKMACPFCDEEMIQGHIWMEGWWGGPGTLFWQEISLLKTGILFDKKSDKALLKKYSLMTSGAKEAFHCSSCGALLTQFEDENKVVQ